MAPRGYNTHLWRFNTFLNCPLCWENPHHAVYCRHCGEKIHRVTPFMLAVPAAPAWFSESITRRWSWRFWHWFRRSNDRVVWPAPVNFRDVVVKISAQDLLSPELAKIAERDLDRLRTTLLKREEERIYRSCSYSALACNGGHGTPSTHVTFAEPRFH